METVFCENVRLVCDLKKGDKVIVIDGLDEVFNGLEYTVESIRESGAVEGFSIKLDGVKWIREFHPSELQKL